jgi:hypothetical protein
LYESRIETLEDLKKAEKKANKVLAELKSFVQSEKPFRIVVDLLTYPKGLSIGGKLFLGDDLVKQYNLIDLLFLDLENLMLGVLLNSRGEESNGL